MEPLRVMSFNVRGSFVDDGQNVWPNRRELNVATILAAEPDVIGFQEVQRGNWDDYLARLAGYKGELGPRYNNEEPHCHPSIFWRTERFEAVDRGGCWLSPTPEKFSKAWDSAHVRSTAWVRLRCRRGGGTLLLANTHLDHISEPARVGQAGVLVEKLTEAAGDGERVVVTGDFNCRPGSDAHRRFIGAGFRDTWTEAGRPDGPDVCTFNGFSEEAKAGGRIDWILARAEPLGVPEARIIRDAAPPLFPSDHFPIVAELTFDG